MAVGRVPVFLRILRRCNASAVVCLMAALYVGAHLPYLSRAPDDLDSVNFALALDEYDLSKHQPHPPGSPLFIAFGRLSRGVMGWFAGQPRSASARRGLDAAALAIWSACFGGLAAFGIFRLAVVLGHTPKWAALATAVTLATPLFWFSGIRPMSDLSGLGVAMIALGMLGPWLMPAPADQEESAARRRSPALLAGCFMAGLAPGFRIQMAWLTWPAVLFAIALAARRDRAVPWRELGAGAAGALLWIVPLTIAAGGPAEYLRLVEVQAGDDVAGGQMVAAHLTLRSAARAAYHSFISPWSTLWLGLAAVSCAAFGALRLVARQPRTAVVLAVIFAPYAVLHLTFQDTAHLRYALPLVPVVAVLAASGLAVLGERVGAVAAALLTLTGVAVGMTPVIAHSLEPAPVFQALDQVRDRLTNESLVRRSAEREGGTEPPIVAMHRAVALAVRGEQIPARVLASPAHYEWLEIAKYWRSGGEHPVWLLANRQRTDLALIDRYSREIMKSFPYPDQARPLYGGRPGSVDWVELRRPGWMALNGWSLTPEIRGVTVRDYHRNRSPHATVLVRRRPEEVAVLLGGRNMGGPCGTAALVTVLVDGREIHRFPTRAGEVFSHVLRLPPGTFAGDGLFAQVDVRAEDTSGEGRQVDVAFEQFDLQSAGNAVVGLGAGWFEPEYDDREGFSFRWMSEHATVRVESFDRDVMLQVRGESPMRYFARPSKIVIRSGAEVLHSGQLNEDFDIGVRVPARMLRANGGAIDLESSQSFVPDRRNGSGDLRAWMCASPTMNRTAQGCQGVRDRRVARQP
jgi:hypothetical protein